MADCCTRGYCGAVASAGRRCNGRRPGYLQASAYRKDLTDIILGCFTTFFGVRRASR